MRVRVCGGAVIAGVDRLLVSIAGGLPALGELQQAVARLCMRRAAPDHTRAAAASASGPPARGAASSRRPSSSALRYATGSDVLLVPLRWPVHFVTCYQACSVPGMLSLMSSQAVAPQPGRRNWQAQ